LKKNKQIVPQNTFTDFLLYTTPKGQVKVEKNKFEGYELEENSVCANFAHTASDEALLFHDLPITTFIWTNSPDSIFLFQFI